LTADAVVGPTKHVASVRVEIATTEFTSKRLDRWAYMTGVTLEFSRRRKPTDNGLIKAFNGRRRAECLNENRFLSLDDARLKVESWRRHQSGERPHSVLGNLAPREFAALSSQLGMAE
jgi:putative transposase